MKQEIESGHFPNNIPYAKLGSGTKNFMILIGGPGNNDLKAMDAKISTRGLQHLTDKYTFWVTSRRQGQPEDYGTREMAADTAAVIKERFDGKMDVLMGTSYGGLLAQYIAIDHPGIVDKFIFSETGYKVSDEVLELDLQMAKYMAAGRNGKAYYTAMGYVSNPGIGRFFMKGIGFLLGSLMKVQHHEHFVKDVVHEGEMSFRHNTEKELGRIKEPILVLGCDRDIAFPPEIQKQTAALIPGAKLVLLKGKAHGGSLFSKDYPGIVEDFLGERA